MHFSLGLCLVLVGTADAALQACHLCFQLFLGYAHLLQLLLDLYANHTSQDVYAAVMALMPEEQVQPE